MSLNATRNYREFLHSKQTERENATKLQQKGGDVQLEHEIAEVIAESQKEKPKEEEPQSFRRRKHKSKNLEEDVVKEQLAIKERRKEAARKGMEHDMREQALGQMYAIPGANVDYDEINKMAKNNIRDTSELVSESLLNDGYTPDEIREISEVGDKMTGYLKGENTIDEIRSLSTEYETKVIAQAYIDTAKQSSVRDVRWLERIDEVCGFEYGAYEYAFDQIRSRDPVADRVLERLEMAMGKERD